MLIDAFIVYAKVLALNIKDTGEILAYVFSIYNKWHDLQNSEFLSDLWNT